jgi:hypothetical protein
MWKLKGCPRCHGDLLWADLSWTCLQCGYTIPETVIYDKTRRAGDTGSVGVGSWSEPTHRN